MNDVPTRSSSQPTSERKAASNRRNARLSTGPKTPRGKSNSRLNALKHGILASQAVLATIEGRAERNAFEQLVDGLGHDFQPVGTFEQVLVQQIAACFWRQRRLLMFENRAAFQARDNRTFNAMNQPLHGDAPLYALGQRKLEGDTILDRARLGLDLPGERDTMRLIRYESSITRGLKTALAQLKAQQQARRASATATARIAPRYEDRDVVVDRKAAKRSRAWEARRQSSGMSIFFHRQEMELAKAGEAELRAEEEAERAQSGEASSPASENYQTKPNMPEDPDALRRHQQLLETADAIVRLGDSLAPKRRFSGKLVFETKFATF